jgi:hypothetical protein
MGKRSDFERIPRDFYPTPYAAVEPLIPHLPEWFTFTEPCAGDGRLIDHLEKNGGKCSYACDIEPTDMYLRVENKDAFDIENVTTPYIITNPPWNRKLLHPMIDHFSSMAPTWLLFDSDWMHTKQSVPYLTKLKKVVSIGRIKWIEGSSSVGKDNCCWYLFDNTDMVKPIEFWGRT